MATEIVLSPSPPLLPAPASEPDEEEPHAAMLTAIVEARRIAIALFIIVFSSHVCERS
jgi:hypothetical protein